MRLSVSLLLFAAVSAISCGCPAGANRPEPTQETVAPADTNKLDPIPKSNNAPGPVESRAQFGQAVRLDDVQVRLTSVKLGKVLLKTIGGTGESSKSHLLVGVALQNMNQTRKLDYKTWAGETFDLDGAFATARDNFGNSYKRVGFGFSTHPVGGIRGSETLYPGKPVADLLVFEAPIEAATYLDFDLPAKNFGGEGVFRFRVPVVDFGASPPKPGKGAPDREADPGRVPERKPEPEPEVKPLVLDLPPGATLPSNDPKDPRPLVVREAVRAKAAGEKLRDRLKNFDGPAKHRSQIEEAAQQWENELGRLAASIPGVKAEAFEKRKARIVADAEKMFPSSKTDLKVRARAEAQQSQYIKDKEAQLRVQIDEEYRLR